MDRINKLRKEIIAGFSHHWEVNDKAHRVEHFEAVYQTGMVIVKRLDLQVDERLVLFAAYFHDLFAWSRVNHHELSNHWMTTTDNPLIVNELISEERRIVGLGCLEHRASFKGNFTSRFSALINSADRGLPNGVESMLARAMDYRKWHFPLMSEDEQMADSILHLKEKYGRKGYARYPDLYIKVFGIELALLQEKIAQL
jgi:hypothetical protein